MLLNEFQISLNSKTLATLLREYTDYAMPIDKLSVPMAEKLLEGARTRLKKFRESADFHTSEKNPAFISTMLTAKLMERWLKEAGKPSRGVARVMAQRKAQIQQAQPVRQAAPSTIPTTTPVTGKKYKRPINSRPTFQQKALKNAAPLPAATTATPAVPTKKKTSKYLKAATAGAVALGAYTGARGVGSAFLKGLKGQPAHVNWDSVFSKFKDGGLPRGKKLEDFLEADVVGQQLFAHLNPTQKKQITQVITHIIRNGSKIAPQNVQAVVSKFLPNVDPSILNQVAAASKVAISEIA